MAVRFGGLDGVLGAGAVRGAPCCFFYHLIHFGIGSGSVRRLERGLRVRLRGGVLGQIIVLFRLLRQGSLRGSLDRLAAHGEQGKYQREGNH